MNQIQIQLIDLGSQNLSPDQNLDPDQYLGLESGDQDLGQDLSKKNQNLDLAQGPGGQVLGQGNRVLGPGDRDLGGQDQGQDLEGQELDQDLGPGG